MKSPAFWFGLFRGRQGYLASMTDSILSHLEHGVMTITLNRPEVFNSFNQKMGQAFQQALDDAAQNDNVRCVVITGSGRAFCAGQDLKEVTSDTSPGFKIIVEETYNRSIRLIATWRSPSSLQWGGRRCRRQHCARLRFCGGKTLCQVHSSVCQDWAGARQRWHVLAA